MRGLKRHATDLPGRWKEPSALTATDHAARRPQQGAGRHRIRRRVGGQCGGRRGRPGRVIPHARAIGTLVIAVIQPTFEAGAMPTTGGARRGLPRVRPTRGRAIRLAAIAGGADRERPTTAPTGLESQRGVHCLSQHRGGHEGLEASTPGPHLWSPPTAYCTGPPSAGRSAAACGQHRARHHRRRTPVSPPPTRRRP